ncbi:MAG: NAD(P)-dependent oxidoreductase [Nitrospirae bacterium]|nr:MAG: NAD(P)-dependent oxidoreductase [Nitrospirota bacterium]
MKTGFIGLGHLGSAMAGRLRSEGVDLLLWNRTREKAEAVGAEVADSPASVISNTDIVFLNLFDSDAVRDVLISEGGILEGDCKGKIVIDTTTNHFDRVDEFYRLLSEKGASYLEAPVLGSVVPASKGALTVVVSGDEDAYKKSLPLLEKIGNRIFFLRQKGLATKMKLINNLVLGTFMATLSEAVALGEKAGIGKGDVIEILGAGGGDSLVLNAKKAKLLNEDFSTHFSCSLIYKDLHYLQDLAKSLQLTAFTGSVIKELYGLAIRDGLGDLDFSAIYRIFSGG